MGKAMEVISGYAVNPSSTLTAVTMATGDSAAVRNFPAGAKALLFDQWAQGATSGFTRTRSPRMHDNVNGIQNIYAAAVARGLLTGFQKDLLYAQDTLTLEISGDASDTDGFTSLIYYTDLPGTAARLHSWNEIEPRVLHEMRVLVSLTSGGTKGNYGGAAAINATQDQFKANTDYAIVGYAVSAECQTIGIRSSDFGNLRVGGPGCIEALETREWFVNLSETLRMPAIPVFNAANKSNTTVDLIKNTTSTAVNVSFICLELATPGGAMA